MNRLRRLNPVRWLRNRRADRAALAAMTPTQRSLVKTFGVPPRFAHTAVIGTYANAADETADWFDYLMGPLVVSYPTPTEADR